MVKETITIEWVRSGQPRPYADSEYEAYISCLVEGMLLDGICFYRDMPPEQVYPLIKAHVRPFQHMKPHGLDSFLELCTAVGATEEMQKKANHPNWLPGKNSRWHVKVVEPYCD